MINRGKIAKRSLEILAAGALILGISLIPGDMSVKKNRIKETVPDMPTLKYPSISAQKDDRKDDKLTPLFVMHCGLNGDYELAAGEGAKDAAFMYNSLGVLGSICEEPLRGTVPLYNLRKPFYEDGKRNGWKNKYTTNREDVSKLVEEGWREMGCIGWIYSEQHKGTLPLIVMESTKGDSCYTSGEKETGEFSGSCWKKRIIGFIHRLDNMDKEDTYRDDKTF